MFENCGPAELSGASRSVNWAVDGADGNQEITIKISEFYASGSWQNIGYPRLLHVVVGATLIAWGNSATTKVQTARLTR